MEENGNVRGVAASATSAANMSIAAIVANNDATLDNKAIRHNAAFSNVSSPIESVYGSIANDSSNDFLNDSIKYAMADTQHNSQPSTKSQESDQHSKTSLQHSYIPLSTNQNTDIHSNNPISNINNHQFTNPEPYFSSEMSNAAYPMYTAMNGSDAPHEPESSNLAGDYGMSSHARDSSVESDHTDTTAVYRANGAQATQGINDAPCTEDSNGVTDSSVESLRQISAQLRGLVTEADTIQGEKC